MSGNRNGLRSALEDRMLAPFAHEYKSMPASAAALLIFLMRSARFMTTSLGRLMYQVKHAR
jgi:hypothetical protein